MFSRFKNFLHRHRRKFVIGGIVVGGIVCSVNYAQRKFIEWQENEAKEFLKRTKKEHHYRCTLKTCNQTIISLSVPLKETILKRLETDEILSRIRNEEENRVALWEEMKVGVLAEVVALLYGGMMLVLMLRIQLNVLGGYMEGGGLSTTFQELYLSLCHHFLERGVHELCTIVHKHSILVLKDISLKQQMALQDIEQLFWRLESSLANDPLNPLKNLNHFLIHETNGSFMSKMSGHNIEGKEAEQMKVILNETVELLQNEEVVSIAESSVKRGFANTVDRIAEFYSPSSSSKSGVGVGGVRLPVAKLVPILHGLCGPPGVPGDGPPQPWIHQFLLMDPLNSLAANLYQAFSLQPCFNIIQNTEEKNIK